MHPRNIYKKQVDFNELAKPYPEFAKISQLDISGKMKVNFKDPESLKVFTKCCLLKDFNLDLILPPDKLLPTIPLRLNYLLWLEDLLNHCGITDNVSGIDIGCGASCIYCLLAVRMHPEWKMFALEVDKQNIEFAGKNIRKNHLDEKITVVTQNESTKLFEKLFQVDQEPKSFCMCNPPFFSSQDEVLGENRTGKRKAPRSLNVGSNSELIFQDGGELGFVTKILTESLQLQDKIQIYSTMFGCKKNFVKFLEDLRGRKIQNFTTTEFVQGKTMRWGVAWSFKHDLKCFKELRESQVKPSASKHILRHEIPGPFEETVKKIKEILEVLKIAIKVIEEKAEKTHRWELTANQNTWSNQRRKRRAEKRDVEGTDQAEDQKNTNEAVTESLTIGFELRNEKNSTQIQMFFISGTMSRDCTNQILQFLKNKIH